MTELYHLKDLADVAENGAVGLTQLNHELERFVELYELASPALQRLLSDAITLCDALTALANSKHTG